MNSTLILTKRNKPFPISCLADAMMFADSDSTIKELQIHLESAFNPQENEEVIRITWGCRRAKGYFSKSIELVRVVDSDFSPKFVITDKGEQISRSTIYRLPERVRVGEILGGRRQVKLTAKEQVEILTLEAQIEKLSKIKKPTDRKIKKFESDTIDFEARNTAWKEWRAKAFAFGPREKHESRPVYWARIKAEIGDEPFVGAEPTCPELVFEDAQAKILEIRSKIDEIRLP